MFGARNEPRASSLLRLLSVCLLLGSTAGIAVAQNDDEPNTEALRPGLIATLTDDQGQSLQRIDTVLSFDWRAERPDPRISTDAFRGEWQGRLFSIVPGAYQLHVFVQGDVTVELNGQRVVVGHTESAGWFAGASIDLEYGYHPLRISYNGHASTGRLALYWSGPQFQLEPVPAWHVFHDASSTVSEDFAQGELLVRALRCNACHALPAVVAPLAAPALTHLRNQVSKPWLVEWILSAGHDAKIEDDDVVNGNAESNLDGLRSRMPSFDLQRGEAEAIAAWLWTSSRNATKPVTHDTTEGHVAAGHELFHTIGCLACHRLNGLGGAGLFGGGDLSQVAAKRPPDFFDRWLADPGQINPAHRMPVFALEDQERRDLSVYLATLGQGNEADFASSAAELEVLAQGRRLIDEFRCGACHALPTEAGAHAPVDITWNGANWRSACTGEAARVRRRPGFRLQPEQAAAVQAFVLGIADAIPADRAAVPGRLVLAQHNCLNCHARGLTEGLGPSATRLVERDERLAPRLPALSPPALTGVGDKLTDAALSDAIATRHAPLRPWLDVRMPKFELSQPEALALVNYFIDQDRIPSPTATTDDPTDTATLHLAGERLVTSAGFGCTSCHQIGSFHPRDVALAARGTNLSQLGQRLRPSWYDRWVRNPARIVPRMEMPSVQQPIRGVLNDDLDLQLTAVWHVLNVPDFEPPAADAVRVVRSRNVPGEVERTSVLTDVLEVGQQRYIKPLLVGLVNRHNVLFDLETGGLAAWWIGDTARQRTRGKTWYWEPAGAALFDPIRREGQWLAEMDGQTATAARRGQFATEFDWLEHLADGVRFGYQLRFDAFDRPIELSITQTILELRETASTKPSSGFECRYEIHGLPRGVRLRLAALPTIAESIDVNGRQLTVPSEFGSGHVEIVEPTDAAWQRADERAWLTLEGADDDVPLSCSVQYRSDATVDQFPVIPPAIDPPAAMALNDVVPGFDAVRLPLGDEFMPTGLAWRPDGTLIVSSLKGRVWLVRDTNGDGLEDQLQPFSDELAAPYGVAARGGAIDVINKYALLRLFDDDRDGRADRMQRLASGWGHTHDYHDWAVGLVDDGEEGYFIALPCQQDGRSPEGAYLRGHVVRLATIDGGYAVEDYCAGLRFPMGLARSTSGDLFATDNQGNYTPFNELNHLLSGRRYGFINKLETRPGFDPPHEPPAVQIPHPWTRSVNGICFLEVPSHAGADVPADHFGPFAGHLIGCEYDTRRLIRMSLQRVGDVYQGAAYPLSLPPTADEESLLGPLVCQVSPAGDLYVGNIRDSAWGGGANLGALVRLRPTGDWPAGVAEVRAIPDGFEIVFTQPIDPQLAAEPTAYAISSYRRQRTPAYGGDDRDRKDHQVLAVDVSDNRQMATVHLDEMRTGFVYEIRVRNIVPDGAPFFPAEAYYTLQRLP